MSRIKWTILAALLQSHAMNLFASEPEISPQMLEQARQAHESLTIPLSVQKRIEAISERVNSDQWQARQASTVARLAKDMGIKTPDEMASAITTPADRAVIFISASIPLQTLRHYAADMEKIEGVMILRGGIEGLQNIQPTLDFIREVLKKEADCEKPDCPLRQTQVLIDPLLFHQFGINVVPALTVIEQFHSDSYCDRDDTETDNNPPVIYGDASVAGLLKEYSRFSATPDTRTWQRILTGLPRKVKNP